jgi:NAD(P)-dependent dehydrogenase (short-subunit alcohol dehydrogenase family)
VTGAARGLGQEFCSALAAEEALIVAADLLPCSETIKRIRKVGGEVMELTTEFTTAIRILYDILCAAD